MEAYEMQKPNLNLSYREQDGMLLPNIQFPTVQEMTARWGDMGGWRSLICVTITRIAIRR